MLALWEAEHPLTVGEVGLRLRLDSGTLTPVLKRLQSAHYIVRGRDAGDERRVLLEVSAAGWQLRDRVAQVPAALATSTSMTPREQAQLRRPLKQLLDNLDSTA